jgi:hypothetical protein
LLWAVWHYPLVIIQGLNGMSGIPVMEVVIGTVMNLAGFTMKTIGETYLFVWLYNQTRSVFLAIVFHALLNTFSTWFLPYLAVPATATLLIGLMPWVVVLVLQLVIGKDFMLHDPAREAEQT